MTSPSSSPARRIDAVDALVVVGFLAFTGGIALLSVPWAFIIAGALLVLAGLRLEVRRRGSTR